MILFEFLLTKFVSFSHKKTADIYFVASKLYILYVEVFTFNEHVHIFSLQKELDDQELKKDRANKQLTKLTREVRSAQKSKGEVPEEKDISVREMREFNQNIMKQIGEVAHNHPDIAPVVNLYFSQAGLPVPPSPGVAGGSRASSLASSRSSVASFRCANFL